MTGGSSQTHIHTHFRLVGGGVPHDSQKVNSFTQRACLQSATFGRPGKVYFMREMFKGSFQLFFKGSNGQGVVSALFSGLKWSLFKG